MTKISKAQASTMRYLYKHIGLSLPEIAESFGCCRANVGLIIKNEIHIDNSYDPLFVPNTILRTHFQKNKRRFNCLFEEAFKPIVGYDGYVIGRECLGLTKKVLRQYFQQQIKASNKQKEAGGLICPPFFFVNELKKKMCIICFLKVCEKKEILVFVDE